MNSDKILTMDVFNFEGKTTLLRVDLNCPIDPNTREFLDKRRLKRHSETIKELSDRNAKVVLLSHQGRPGSEFDFTILKKHAEEVSNFSGIDIKYMPDIIGPSAKERIKNLKDGEVLLLENTRFLSEEMLNRLPDAQATTHFVKNLAPLADLFVCDAFATAHRSQPSLVGFAEVLPSCAGRVMEHEIKMLDKVIEEAKTPCIFISGGAKLNTSIKVIRRLLDIERVDKVLTCGLVGIIFLRARGYKIRGLEYIKDYDKLINDAKNLLESYQEKIILPSDVALDKYGKRIEISVAELPAPYRIADIGKETIEYYKEIIKESKTIIANGPAGIFEQKEFSIGTNELVKSVANSNAFSLVGGGHIASAVVKLKLEKKISHISTGGKACIAYLAGEALPAIEVLKRAAERYNKNSN